MEGSLSLILFSVVCGISGQLMLKMGMSQVGQIGAHAFAQPAELAIRVASSPLVVVGLGMYALGTVAWLTVLSRVQLSLAYPLLALSYAFTPVLATFFLKESVPSVRWLGIGTICAGVFLVSRT